MSRATSKRNPRTEALGPFPVLSDEEKRASREAAMARAPGDGDVWVFAYGSLMWDPCFKPAETVQGVLHGYRRRFNFWTIVARGTPERPGLGLGLEAGEGRCKGLLYRLGDEGLEANLEALWSREMYSGVYVPSWVPVEAEGTRRTALTFVIDPAHPQYAPEMSLDEKAAIIAEAAGKYGPCSEYLANVIAGMAELGVREPEFETLLARAEALRSAPGQSTKRRFTSSGTS